MCDTRVRPARARKTPQPRWTLLYGLAFSTLGAVAAVGVIPLPGAWQAALRSGLGIGGFAAMAMWVRLNRAALDLQDWCECAGSKITVRVIPSDRPEPERVEVKEEALEEVAC